MAIPLNKKLYERAKQIADQTYSKPSAYKSGFIVKLYLRLGGTYKDASDKEKPLARWFKEKWADVGNKEYPVYRPTVRVNSSTPLTPDEIDPKDLKKQIEVKQILRSDKNLQPFKKKS